MKTILYKLPFSVFRHFFILFLIISYGTNAQVAFEKHEVPRYIDSPSSNYICDFNGDGNLDFMVEGGMGIVIYLNQGDWEFIPQRIHSEYSSGIAISDMDKDGDMDFFIQDFYTALI